MNSNNVEEFSCTGMQHSKYALHATDSAHKDRVLKYLKPLHIRKEPVLARERITATLQFLE
jgi:hypothetical protein